MSYLGTDLIRTVRFCLAQSLRFPRREQSLREKKKDDCCDPDMLAPNSRQKELPRVVEELTLRHIKV